MQTFNYPNSSPKKTKPGGWFDFRIPAHDGRPAKGWRRRLTAWRSTVTLCWRFSSAEPSERGIHSDRFHSGLPRRYQTGSISSRKKGLRYQTYLKMLLHEALEHEERRAS